MQSARRYSVTCSSSVCFTYSTLLYSRMFSNINIYIAIANHNNWTRLECSTWKRGRWLCMEGCRAQVIYINAEGRKGAVDMTVLLAVVHGARVLLSVCWLMKWTQGLRNWFWLRGWSPSLLLYSLPVSPHFSTSLPCPLAVLSTRIHSLKLKAILKVSVTEVVVVVVVVQHKQGGTSCSRCPLLLAYMSVGTGETVT